MRLIFKEILPFAVAAIVIAIVVFGYLAIAPQIASGSVITGQAYNATTTNSTSAGTFWQARSTSNVGGCELGSVVIASTTATAGITLKNATSTSDVSSSTIAAFPANAAAGTYTFDMACKRGLIIETPTGFNGQFVVTWR